MKLALGKVKEKLDFMGEIRYSRERKCRKYVGLIVIWDILKRALSNPIGWVVGV